MSGPNLARAAAWYAAHGWPVFPLRPRTKEPFAGLGVYRATCDAEQVAAWWRAWPQANIGLHAGAAGLLALDLDTYKEHYDGAGLLSLAEQATLTNLSGGGGTHLLYALAAGQHYGNRPGALPEGIDVRCWGGYVVLPPSVHPNGTRYAWEGGYGPHECCPLPMPAALNGLLAGAVLRPARGGPEADAGAPADEVVDAAVATVETVLRRLGLSWTGRRQWGDGLCWILAACPFAPAEDSHGADGRAYVAVTGAGHIAASCHHRRCLARLRALHTTGWRFLLQRGCACG